MSPSPQDLKAANLSLANELTRQRQRHDREVAELKQQLAQVTAEYKAEHAQTVCSHTLAIMSRPCMIMSVDDMRSATQDQARELKVAELTAREHAAARTSQHLMELQEQ